MTRARRNFNDGGSRKLGWPGMKKFGWSRPKESWMTGTRRKLDDRGPKKRGWQEPEETWMTKARRRDPKNLNDGNPKNLAEETWMTVASWPATNRQKDISQIPNFFPEPPNPKRNLKPVLASGDNIALSCLASCRPWKLPSQSTFTVTAGRVSDTGIISEGMGVFDFYCCQERGRWGWNLMVGFLFQFLLLQVWCSTWLCNFSLTFQKTEWKQKKKKERESSKRGVGTLCIGCCSWQPLEVRRYFRFPASSLFSSLF